MTDIDHFSSIDIVIQEMISFLLYKRGKAPLGDIDPRKRIKKGVWKDEGLDLTLFLSGDADPSAYDIYLEMETMEVKRGFFRKKGVHRVATGLKELDIIKTGTEEELSSVLGSRILHPMAFIALGDQMDDVVDSIDVERRPQTLHADLSPEKVLGRSGYKNEHDLRSEDLLKLFKRKISKDHSYVTDSGMRIRDLSSLFDHVFSCDDSDLGPSISNGDLSRFARDGLKSPTLEALFKDLSLDPTGGKESPGSFRKRFGRWTLESTLSDNVVNEIVPRLLSRLMSCSLGEARKLSDALSPLIDPRSTSILTEKIFSADPEFRPYLIMLLGMAGDRAAQETLKRLMEYSNVDDDRRSAKEALRSMGVEIKMNTSFR